MPPELRGSQHPLARNCTHATIEAETAQALDAAVNAYLSTLSGTQRLLWFRVLIRPNAAGTTTADNAYSASLITAG